jgi:hypothetical protein
MITSNKIFLLTALSSCLLLISALPKSVNIVGDDANRLVKEESDGSSTSDEYVLPLSRYGRINEPKLMGRKNDAQSKCGYEVREKETRLDSMISSPQCLSHFST